MIAPDLMKLIQDDAADRALGEAIRRIHALHGNDKYKSAWKVAIRVLNDMLVARNQLVTDKAEQISSASERTEGTDSPAVKAGAR